ncbi:conserved hypothetical protein (putative transposase or invertase) [bacterium A37T11]|nr:conserved hypothetical protein (putative transposase or invertase) [bacterium A37T11]
MADISSPHDSFFRTILDDKQVAVEYFKSALPEHISQKLDFSTMERLPDSYVSGKLAKSMSDSLYSCRRLDGKGNVEISILVEHKSYPDKHTPLQIGSYLLSCYQQQIKQGQKQLVPIIPVLFYHGRKKWEYWTLDKLFGELDQSLLGFIPNFAYVYNDIGDTADEVILATGNHFLASSLLLLKHSHDKQWLNDNFIPLLQMALQGVSIELQQSLLTYYFSRVDLTKEKVIEEIKKLPSNIKNSIMSTYEMLLEEGRKEERVKAERLIEQERERAEMEREKAERERANAYAEKLKSAAEFKKMGVPFADIAKGLNLSIEEIEKV